MDDLSRRGNKSDRLVMLVKQEIAEDVERERKGENTKAKDTTRYGLLSRMSFVYFRVLSRKTIVRLFTVLAVMALAKGCGDGDSPTAPSTPEPARPTTVTVSPAVAGLTALGQTFQLTVTVTSAAPSATVTWTSSANSVATVNASGLVTAAGNGTATITAAVEPPRERRGHRNRHQRATDIQRQRTRLACRGGSRER